MTCFRQNDIHAKTCNRLTTLKSSSFSRQNNAGSRVRTTSLWENLAPEVVLFFKSTGLYHYIHESKLHGGNLMRNQ